MKKILLLVLMAGGSLASAAQTTDVLDINNVVARINASTIFYQNQALYDAGFEVPAGNGVHSIYASRLWIGGIDESESLHIAAGTFGPNYGEHDFYPGPLRIDGTASTDAETMIAFNRVWKVNNDDVTTHIQYFDAVNNGTVDIEFPNGYTMPEYFNDWPAHGDVSNGFAFNLAPFIDYNQDGIYNPENGDAPLICGDQAIYFIVNDNGGPHTETNGASIGVEIHAMAYAFNMPGTAMNNSIFVKFRIIQRGDVVLNESYVGIWTDLDLGQPTDDLLGTDVANSAYFVYNDPMDEPGSASPGYGEFTPRQAVQFLAGPYMDDDNSDNDFPEEVIPFDTDSYGPFAMGFNDGVADNERLGLTSSMYYNNSSNPIVGEPTTPVHHYNFMKSVWKNNQHLSNGGNGFLGPGVQSEVQASYMFPGTSNPFHLGTEGGVPNLWTEETSGNLPGDRRMVGGSGPFTIQPGVPQELDIAYVYAEETGSGMTEEAWLRNQLQEVKAFFHSNLEDCLGGDLASGVVTAPALFQGMFLFPNPANSSLTIKSVSEVLHGSITITDSMGRLILAQGLETSSVEIDVSHLSEGMYYARWTNNDKSVVLPFVISH